MCIFSKRNFYSILPGVFPIFNSMYISICFKYFSKRSTKFSHILVRINSRSLIVNTEPPLKLSKMLTTFKIAIAYIALSINLWKFLPAKMSFIFLVPPTTFCESIADCESRNLYNRFLIMKDKDTINLVKSLRISTTQRGYTLVLFQM